LSPQFSWLEFAAILVIGASALFLIYLWDFLWTLWDGDGCHLDESSRFPAGPQVRSQQWGRQPVAGWCRRRLHVLTNWAVRLRVRASNRRYWDSALTSIWLKRPAPSHYM